jgi:hypothetical protein
VTRGVWGDGPERDVGPWGGSSRGGQGTQGGTRHTGKLETRDQKNRRRRIAEPDMAGLGILENFNAPAMEPRG